MLEFEGEDYRGKQRTGMGIAWIEPPRRERKPVFIPKETRPVEIKPKVRPSFRPLTALYLYLILCIFLYCYSGSAPPKVPAARGISILSTQAHRAARP